jgi:Type I phosphodiesterase / nucleotide pyrophosphatase
MHLRPQRSGGPLARLALLVPFLLPSCLARPTTLASPIPAPRVQPVLVSPEEAAGRAVVLVAVDGARWQEVLHGVDRARAHDAELPIAQVVGPDELMPNLHRLTRTRGVLLPSVFATGPNYVSMPGYAEMFTGRAPARCQDNACSGPGEATIFDEARTESDHPGDVAVIASWEGIGRVASTSTSAGPAIVVSTGRHGTSGIGPLFAHPETRQIHAEAARADPSPGLRDYRPDAYTRKLALAYLAAEKPRLLFVGLGDTDEHAHRGNYGAYLEALRGADAFLGDLDEQLARMGDRGRRTTVIVTADHGRARSFRDHGDWAPESARVWLGAFAGDGPREPLAALGPPRPRSLADIAPTVRALLGVAPTKEGAEEGRAIAEVIGL